MSLAERALESRVGAAIFDATETGVIALGDTFAVLEVNGKVVALVTAGLARTDGFVALDVVGMFGAEVSSAVLARVHRLVVAARESSSDPAVNRCSHFTP